MAFPIEHDGKLFPTFLAAGGYLAAWTALLFQAPPWVCAAFGLDAAIGGAGSAVVHVRRKEAAPALAEGFVAVSAGAATAAAFVPAKAMPDPRIAIGVWLAGYGAALTMWVEEETGGEVSRFVAGVLRRLSGAPASLASGLAAPARKVSGLKSSAWKVGANPRSRRRTRKSRVVFSSEIPDWLTSGEKKRGAR